MVSPRLIAFEGVDGAGKSTVIRYVTEVLRGRGIPVFLPRTGKEHDSRPTRMIRRLTRDARNLDLTPRAELALYCAREAQVLEENVRPALARGETVLLDRSLLTPIVQGAFGRGLPRADCEAIAGVASAGLEPDHTLVFDVHPRTSRVRKRIEKVRSRSREPGGRKGLLGSALKERIRDGYVAMADARRHPVFHVERASPAVLAERVMAFLDRGVRPEDLESDGDRAPVWKVPASWTFAQAIDSLPDEVALFLTNGLIAGRALRARLLDLEPELVAWSLDPEDPLREAAGERAPDYALRGLSRRPLRGDDDLRLRLLQKEPAHAVAALRFVTGDAADGIRRANVETAPGAVASSLTGREDPEATALRRLVWKRAEPEERAAALVGCSGEAAWQLREKLLEDEPALGLESLRGTSSDRGDALLGAYVERAPRPVLRALAGRSDAAAHSLRQRLLTTGREVIDSVRGLDDAASWELREAWVGAWPSTVAHSLTGVAEGPRASGLRARCAALADGDVHVLRRLQGLAEYGELPAWATERLTLDGGGD